MRKPVVCVAMVALVLAGVDARAQAPVQPAESPNLGEVFSEMPRDLWRFLSWDTAGVLLFGGAAASIGHVWDAELAGELEVNVRLNNALEPGHTYGAFSFQSVIGIGVYTVGWFADHEGLATTGADIMRAQVLSQLYTQAIKYSAQRQRPDDSNNLSFPSGHSASAFATAAVLQRHYGWKVGVPAVVAAAYVATARVHDNHHYLSDVIFGGAMGMAAERTITLRAGRYGIVLAPAPVPGGAGVFAQIR